jgi:hypothetical protein
MKVVAIFYTDKNYRPREEELFRQLHHIGFDDVWCHEREWLETTTFYKENKKILDFPRGGGYWLWKPYVILETFKSIKDGDVVFYLDAGDDASEDTVRLLREHLINNDYMISGLSYRPLNRQYIKKDCFVLMGAESEEYYNTPQNEAGAIAFKKTRFNEHFLEEWLFYCKNENILTDISNIHGENDPTFIRHMHDQAILSILTTRHKMGYSEELYLSMNFNVYTPTK